MKRLWSLMVAAACTLLFVGRMAAALPLAERHELAPAETGEVDAEGDVEGTRPKLAKASGDTVWIADWSFDAGDGCDDTGWVKLDNRILNDGSNYWHIGSEYNGTGGITGKAAILSKHDLCWVVPTGYGNNWDYSIILKYQGTGSTLSFNFRSDSEPGYDFFKVEADSAGASESRVNYTTNPAATSAAVYRDELLSYSGFQSAGTVSALALPDFGVPAVTHEVYLRFVSEGGYSDEDGLYPTSLGAGLVVDNVAVTGTPAYTYTEDFDGILNINITLVNSALSLPFGQWARLFKHVTDNDRCTENTTCAWLWTDPLRIAVFPNMAFGPGSGVVHSWLDNIIMSPWVSLATTPSATGTPLVWRRYPGNDFNYGRIVQSWSVRSQFKRDNTDTSTPGDSIDCLGPWGHTSQWNSLTSFVWGTNSWDMTSYIDSRATAIQIRLRVSDWQYIAGATPPGAYNPGPGPYNDRIRIGRLAISGPVMYVGIDTRTQAQDCFPTKLASFGTPGRTYAPETDTSAPLYPYLFGTCAFSAGTELGIGQSSPNLITADSIWMKVTDNRGAGGITSVKLYGAIVAGPHAGKAPAPLTVGTNGFFEVVADSCKNPVGVWIENLWNVDFDDTYFRGGDQLVYFWLATDAGAGRSSQPQGITAGNFPPASVAAADIATGGLYEVSYLPVNNWDPAYLARIAVDPHGDLEPTAGEVANSSQRNCLLYYQHVTSNRRSGQINRTTFMYTLDRLGYAGHYDVYDVQGYGNTNNQLGGRATVAQASGYALIIEDDGRSNLTPNVTDGIDLDAEKVNQALWYRNYLAQGLTGRAGAASLWIIGENTAYEERTNPLFAVDMGLATVATDQGLAASPDVLGVGSASTWDGCTMSVAGDVFTLAGGCPTIRAYDTATATGTATITHRYKTGAATGNGAVILNKNAALHWNTVWQGFPLFDVRNPSGGTYPPPTPVPANPYPAATYVQKLLACLLPVACQRTPGVTDEGGDDTAALPRVSALYQNVPNPFNPVTTIRFDLAREGHVELRVYDVAGHLVKTLINGPLTPGWNIAVPWNGLSDAGSRVPSGVYFYRLVAAETTATKKMVLMK